jgi:hypothetical protein
LPERAASCCCHQLLFMFIPEHHCKTALISINAYVQCSTCQFKGNMCSV